MRTENVKLTEEQASEINKKINELTEVIIDKLDNTGIHWLPIMVYATQNILAVANEMSRQAGNDNADLIDLTETFCNQLMECVKIRKEFITKNMN